MPTPRKKPAGDKPDPARAFLAKQKDKPPFALAWAVFETAADLRAPRPELPTRAGLRHWRRPRRFRRSDHPRIRCGSPIRG